MSVWVDFRKFESVVGVTFKEARLYKCYSVAQQGMKEYVGKQILVDQMVEFLQDLELTDKETLIKAVKARFDT